MIQKIAGIYLVCFAGILLISWVLHPKIGTKLWFITIIIISYGWGAAVTLALLVLCIK